MSVSQNGNWPVSIWYSMTPAAHTSMLMEWQWSVMTSGAMYTAGEGHSTAQHSTDERDRRKQPR